LAGNTFLGENIFVFIIWEKIYLFFFIISKIFWAEQIWERHKKLKGIAPEYSPVATGLQSCDAGRNYSLYKILF